MIALDTFDLLKRIAAAPQTFVAVERDIERVAIASVRKLLKARGLTLEELRSIKNAIGADSLGFILGHDSMKDNDIKGLVKKLDKHWPAISDARIDAQRQHVLALATGAAVPAEKMAAAPRAPAKKAAEKPKTAEWSKAMSAKPKDR